MAHSAKQRRLIAAIVGVAACVGAGWYAWQVLDSRAATARFARLSQASAAVVPPSDQIEQQVRAFCGDCHALPRPESFHRDAWYDEVRIGYQMYGRSGRTDLAPPPIEATVHYFRSQAPDRMSYPQSAIATRSFAATFAVVRWRRGDDSRTPPSMSHMRWLRLDPASDPVMVASDLRSGWISTFDVRPETREPRRVTRLRNPCRFEPCDLDADGRLDLLVADLGSSSANDHDLGQVVCLRRLAGSEGFEPVVLADGLGRVADVRPADFDGDGRVELIVAEFGLDRTGKVLLYTNELPPPAPPRFTPRVLDPRPGGIHVPVLDLDQDGRLDALALISQETECVDALLNRGAGRFQRRSLWRADDLTFGSNGIELIDLDGDGDTDILLTNGDAFDNLYVSPWHGVQWLENLGPLRYRHRRLTDLSGACRTVTGDFDNDGDLDIVVTAWLPSRFRPDTLSAETLPSIVLLEQTAAGVFARHNLQVGFPYYATIEKGDFDGDGDLDFAVGVNAGDLVQADHWLEIWWNQQNNEPRKTP
jgi:hypothetical protein